MAKILIRPRTAIALAGVALAACHVNDKPLTPAQQCQACCEQQRDACKIGDSDRPEVQCRDGHQACLIACAEENAMEWCVTSTRPKEHIVQAASPATAAPAPRALGECDGRGAWQLELSPSSAPAAASCRKLDALPRRLRFSVARVAERYAVSGLVAEAGWRIDAHVEPSAAACTVTLTLENTSDPERALATRLEVHKRKDALAGSFVYREQPPALPAPPPPPCELTMTVEGHVIEPARAAEPPPAAPAPPRRARPWVSTDRQP